MWGTSPFHFNIVISTRFFRTTYEVIIFQTNLQSGKWVKRYYHCVANKEAQKWSDFPEVTGQDRAGPERTSKWITTMVLKEWVNIPGCSQMVCKAGRGHTDSVLDQGLRQHCRRKPFILIKLSLKTQRSATRKSAKKKTNSVKAKLLNSCPLASELGMRWLLRTKKGKRISTDQTCITEPNLGLLVRHAAEPIYWHQVVRVYCRTPHKENVS